jgi:spore coat polysaccharide biosynthesis protein SpsF
MMTVTAIVQARMTSTRFPGKVLADLAGRPMILQQLARLKAATTITNIVIATSDDSSDDELAAVVSDAGYLVVRGSLDDVLSRFVTAMDAHPCDIAVRITADCPMLMPEVVDEVVTRFLETEADYVSNTLEPTFPDGVDVEVVQASVLREIASSSRDAAEREHVTLGVYRRPDQYRVENVVRDGEDLSGFRWTVDTPADLEFVRRVYARLGERFSMDEVLALLSAEPSLVRTQADGRRNAALDGLDTGAMKHRQR